MKSIEPKWGSKLECISLYGMNYVEWGTIPPKPPDYTVCYSALYRHCDLEISKILDHLCSAAVNTKYPYCKGKYTLDQYAYLSLLDWVLSRLSPLIGIIIVLQKEIWIWMKK